MIYLFRIEYNSYLYNMWLLDQFIKSVKWKYSSAYFFYLNYSKVSVLIINKICLEALILVTEFFIVFLGTVTVYKCELLLA
jgi:hypothetical protein